MGKYGDQFSSVWHGSKFPVPVISSNVPNRLGRGTWLLVAGAVSAGVGFTTVFTTVTVFGTDGTLAGGISGLSCCTLICLRGLNFIEASRQMVLSSLILFASICDPLMCVMM